MYINNIHFNKKEQYCGKWKCTCTRIKQNIYSRIKTMWPKLDM
uniref:Uncharacterized protein n=1 Tax=Rhizophora mucronata TaxID=61149 RepID=A0A2P2J1X7_RHIMU